MAYRFAVLGDPIEHSRSPVLHGAMLELAGLEGTYSKIRADPTTLSTAVGGLRAGEWSGLNVTMPLKAEAARLADDLSAPAARSGSVNTLIRDGDSILGETTDAVAFEELAGSPRFTDRSSVLILGSGGSAAAALAALGEEPALYVTGRTPGHVDEITGRLGGEPVEWGSPVAGALVINATTLGMTGGTLPEGVIEAASGLIDLPYGDADTAAVSLARRLGLPVADGHEFLLRQARASFALWTGVEIAIEALDRRLRNT